MDLRLITSSDEFYGDKRVAGRKFGRAVCPGVDELLIRNDFLERSTNEPRTAIGTVCLNAILSTNFQFLRHARTGYLIAAKPLADLFWFRPCPVHLFHGRFDRSS